MVEKTAKLDAGTWNKLSTSDLDQKPKLSFDVNIPIVVEFTEDTPAEMPSQDGGVYYMFHVNYNNEDRVIQTSAFTLLKAIKKLEPLKGKKVEIVKKLIKGKQSFEVTLKS